MTVTLELLFPYLDELIQAPADVQRLNEAILQLAVQGKLVGQDPHDEPAGALLKSLAVEKERLVAEDKIREEKPLPPINEDEVPFALPVGWEWARFTNVANIATNSTDPTLYPHLPHVAPDNIEKFSGKLLGYRTVIEDGVTSIKHRFYPGQILYSKIRPNLSKVVIVDFEGLCSADMYPIDAYINARYLLNYMLSGTFIGMATKTDTRVAMPKINQDTLSKIVVAVPPLAEQKRLVAKVDELFAQTRALEAKLRRAQEAIVVVNRAVLHHLHHAADNATFQHAAQILGDHFDLLYTDPRPVTDLRQTILQLAVQGKLVPQVPHDEPAGELLKRIVGEKERLVEQGEAKRSGLLSPINSDDALFELPKGWAWCRLDDLLLNIEAGQSFNAQSQPASNTEFGVLKVSAVSWGQFLPQENKALWPGTIPDQKARVAAGDMLISRANTAELVGAVVLVEQDYPNLFLSDKTLRLVLVSCELSKPFLVFALRSPWVRQFFVEQATGTSTSMRNLSQEKMRNTPIALPPLAEQKRIIAKVDELLARCAALERKLGQAQVAGRQLTAAVLQGVVG